MHRCVWRWLCLFSAKPPSLISASIYISPRFYGNGSMPLYSLLYLTSKRHPYCVHLPPIRRYSACYALQDLTSKKCAPCNSKDIKPLTEQSANELLPQVPGWNLLREGAIMKLQRSWKVKSFSEGLELFQLVAEVAEAEGHHPDLHLVGWNNVKIDIWTHSVGGLTENDFILAAKISALQVDHLLRKKTNP